MRLERDHKRLGFKRGQLNYPVLRGAINSAGPIHICILNPFNLIRGDTLILKEF